MVVMRLPQDKASSIYHQQHLSTYYGSGQAMPAMPKSPFVHAMSLDNDCRRSHGGTYPTIGSSRLDVARASFRRPAPRDWITDRPTKTNDDTIGAVTNHKRTHKHYHRDSSIDTTRTSSFTSCRTALTTKSSDGRRQAALTPTAGRRSNTASHHRTFVSTSDVALNTANFNGFPSRQVEYEPQPNRCPSSRKEKIPKEILIMSAPTMEEIPIEVSIPPDPDEATSDVSLEEFCCFSNDRDDRTLTPHPSFEDDNGDDNRLDDADISGLQYLYQSSLQEQETHQESHNQRDRNYRSREGKGEEDDGDDDDTAGLMESWWGVCNDFKVCTQPLHNDLTMALASATFGFLQDPEQEEDRDGRSTVRSVMNLKWSDGDDDDDDGHGGEKDKAPKKRNRVRRGRTRRTNFP